LKLKRFLSVLNLAAASLLFATPAFAAPGDIPNPRTDWDELWYEVLVDITVIGVIFIAAAIYMLIRFKATSPDQVGTAKPLSTANAIGWALIPAAIFMADDLYLAAKGWTVWDHQRTVPENAMEIKVTGYQWYWEFEYEDGTETDELKVPVGTPVVLRMTSDDVIHSFGLPYYRVTEDVMPGRITYIWFNPTEEIETLVTCREFCGNSHSEMYTAVEAVPPAEFEEWLAEQG
jgi:cytochrome c oxidase subunit 2